MNKVGGQALASSGGMQRGGGCISQLWLRDKHRMLGGLPLGAAGCSLE